MKNRKFENKMLAGFVGFLLVIFGVQGINTVNPDLFKGSLTPNIYGGPYTYQRPIIRTMEYIKDISVDCDTREEHQLTNCYYRIPLGFEILPSTIMEIDGEESRSCEQDQLNLVMCSDIYLGDTGSQKIYIRENGTRYKTESKINIYPAREKSRVNYDFSDLYTFQQPGRTLYTMVPENKLFDDGNLRCQDYFYDVRKTNIRCGKVTVLREMGIFTGQKNNNTRIPVNLRLPNANLDNTLKRAEFFVLADRMLNQSMYLRTQENLSLLEKFSDLENQIIYKTDNNWWTGAAARLIERGVMKGYDDNTLRPYDLVTEAEFAKVIANIRGANIQNATDGPWYTNLLNYWRGRGTYIEPLRFINRATAVDILYEALYL
jgi:hypothetical protein